MSTPKVRTWYDEFRTDVFWISIIVLIMVFISSFAHNSTDYPGEHSGIKPHIDAKTGCHYLSTSSGALVPRLDKNGVQICTGQETE